MYGKVLSSLSVLLFFTPAAFSGECGAYHNAALEICSKDLSESEIASLLPGEGYQEASEKTRFLYYRINGIKANCRSAIMDCENACRRFSRAVEALAGRTLEVHRAEHLANLCNTHQGPIGEKYQSLDQLVVQARELMNQAQQNFQSVNTEYLKRVPAQVENLEVFVPREALPEEYLNDISIEDYSPQIEKALDYLQ